MSTVSERQRLDLYERLGETLGRDHAEVLMEYLPPVGWGDVARRHDVDALRLAVEGFDVARRHDVDALRLEVQAGQSDVRAEMADLRGELRTGLSEVRIELHEQLVRFLIWIVGTIFGSVALVLGLIAYVS